jgi:5-methyltetrahydrofolate--homocysteine methyltransferase
MRPLLDRLADGEILVSDGAMGTMLFERGLDPGDSPERMMLTAPDVLSDVAIAYMDAGAELVHANTFGASPLKLADYELQSKTEELNRTAVSIVRDAVGDRAYVAASVGPCGKILEPYGDVAEEAVYESFERQMEALASEGVDCVTVETMTDLREAVLAVRAARHVMPDTPVLCTMTFDETPKGLFTIMGVDVPTAVAGLQDAGADVVGSNCGYGIEHMVNVAAAFRQATPLPILIQANAGTPELKDRALIFPESPGFFAEQTERLLDAGASIVGGCCGTTPDYIRAMREVVDRRTQ